MKDHVIIRTIALLLLPLIFLFGFYILFHGEVSPGGGFQGGAIWATAVCLHALVFSVEETRRIFRPVWLKAIACIGGVIYAGVGFLTIFLGGRFLDYNVLADSPHTGQLIGITAIEIGVQLTVFGVLSLIFLRIANQED